MKLLTLTTIISKKVMLDEDDRKVNLMSDEILVNKEKKCSKVGNESVQMRKTSSIYLFANGLDAV